MSYSHSHTGNQFLLMLNSRIVVEDSEGTKVRRRTSEDNSQLQLSFVPQFELVFVNDIEVMLETQCSDAVGFDRTMPWDFGNELEPEGYIQMYVRKNNPSSVLVIPQCCGQYSGKWQELLMTEFPKVTWYFPRLDDFCDNIHDHCDDLVRNLLDAGIVKVVPVSVDAVAV